MTTYEAALIAWADWAAMQRWRPGQWDCCMAPASWVERVTGVDPAADLRGTYHDRAGMDALVAQGLAAVVGPRLKAAGFKRRWIGFARPGDVGLVVSGGPGKGPPVFGGVRMVDGMWGTAAARGVSFVRGFAIAVWTPAHG